MEQHEKYLRMTTEPVERLVGRMAGPTIVTMLVTALYNMADTFFVGLLDNTSATGAVGVVFSFMAIIQACGFFFGHGSGNTISRLLGKEQVKEAEHVLSVGFFSALIVGVGIMAGGLAFLTPLARLLGSTQTILPYAREYLGIILLGTPWIISSYVLNNQLRYQGNAFYSMLGMVSGAVLNIVLDPVFIFTFDMGVAGAALATSLSQFVSFLVLLLLTLKGDNLRLRIKAFRPGRAVYGEILRGGLPTLFRQGLSSFATIALNVMAGTFGGDATIAAMTVATKVIQVSFFALLGFGQGFQPVCGYNFGAGLYDRVKRAFWFCVRIGSGLLLVASAAEFVFARQLVQLFSSDPPVVEMGTLALRLLCLTFPLIAWITMSNMMTQTIGRVGPATFLSVSRQGVFFIPLVLALPPLLEWVFPGGGLWGVMVAQPAADLLTFLASIPITARVMRRDLTAGKGK